MSFPVSDAAFEGFRIARERPRSVLVWALVYFVFSMVLGIIVVTILGPDAAKLANPPANMSESQALALLPLVGKLFGVAFPLLLIMGAVLTGAVFRVIFRPDQGALGYLRLGLEELRLIGAVVITTVAGVVAGSLIGGVIGFIVGFGFAVTNTPVSPTLGGLLGSGFSLVAGVWLSVRLSLMGPMAFTEGRLRPLAAWRRTQGKFWQLFGAYLLACIFAVIVWMLGMIIAYALRMVLAQTLGAAGAGALITAGIYLAIVSLVAVLINAIIQAPAAVIHRSLRDETAAFE